MSILDDFDPERYFAFYQTAKKYLLYPELTNNATSMEELDYILGQIKLNEILVIILVKNRILTPVVLISHGHWYFDHVKQLKTEFESRQINDMMFYPRNKLNKADDFDHENGELFLLHINSLGYDDTDKRSAISMKYINISRDRQSGKLRWSHLCATKIYYLFSDKFNFGIRTPYTESLFAEDHTSYLRQRYWINNHIHELDVPNLHKLFTRIDNGKYSFRDLIQNVDTRYELFKRQYIQRAPQNVVQQVQQVNISTDTDDLEGHQDITVSTDTDDKEETQDTSAYKQFISLMLKDARIQELMNERLNEDRRQIDILTKKIDEITVIKDELHKIIQRRDCMDIVALDCCKRIIDEEINKRKVNISIFEECTRPTD
jgi:hypothetical protein